MDMIKQRRKELGLTQETLAKQLNVSKAYISFLERGLRSPSVKIAKKLEIILEIPWTHHYK